MLVNATQKLLEEFKEAYVYESDLHKYLKIFYSLLAVVRIHIFIFQSRQFTLYFNMWRGLWTIVTLLLGHRLNVHIHSFKLFKCIWGFTCTSRIFKSLIPNLLTNGSLKSKIVAEAGTLTIIMHITSLLACTQDNTTNLTDKIENFFTYFFVKGVLFCHSYVRNLV